LTSVIHFNLEQLEKLSSLTNSRVIVLVVIPEIVNQLTVMKSFKADMMITMMINGDNDITNGDNHVCKVHQLKM